MYSFSQLNLLFTCLNSTKSCFDAFFSLPLTTWFELPYMMWSMLGHTIVVLSKLTHFTCEGWDQQYVRTVLDFSETVDTVARKLDEARALAELSAQQTVAAGDNSLPRGVPELFSTLPLKFHQIKAAHEAMSATRALNRSELMQDHSAGANTTALSENDLAMPSTAALFEFLDDSFWVQFN